MGDRPSNSPERVGRLDPPRPSITLENVGNPYFAAIAADSEKVEHATPAVSAVDTARAADGRLSSRRRLSMTVLGTFAVVLLEFALLHEVYHYGAAARQAQVVVARVQGELHASTPAGALGRIASIRADLAGLPAGGAAKQRALDAARRFGPKADRAELRNLRAAVDHLAAGLHSQTAHAAGLADLIYAGLLIIASLGWMTWFRRLVSRHRKLQQQVTETQLMARSDQRLAALVQNATDLVILCADGLITFATPSSRAVLGLDPKALIGRPWLDYVAEDHRDSFAASLRSLAMNEDRDINLRIHHANGDLIDAEGTMTDLRSDPAVGALLITVRDVTNRVDLERQLRHQAFYDSLTGLANRQLFSDRLAHALARTARTTEETVAVLFCDLDDFKHINDSLGHRVGDLVLTGVARRAESVVGAADTVARLGGDEIAILLEDTDADTASRVARDVLDALSEPIDADGRELLIHASIGLAMGSAATSSGDDLLRNADVAMYLAKERGKGTLATYDSELHTLQLDRLDLTRELEHAIAHDELTVHYQPIVDLQTRTISGFEALVRWHHPTRGLLNPAQFIPIAEKSGLIVDLGRVVMRKACDAGVAFNRGSRKDIYVSVNVAALQMSRSGFVDEVRTALSESRLPGRLLVVEMTETAVVNDLAETIERLSELRRLGIRVAIDDFGTGYSSLSYLRDLPLDILKLDKAFVDDAATDSNQAALTRAILTMSRGLRLLTVAEGVEDEAQATWLTRSRCGYGQGFLWSRPLSRADAAGLLKPSPLDDLLTSGDRPMSLS